MTCFRRGRADCLLNLNGMSRQICWHWQINWWTKNWVDLIDHAEPPSPLLVHHMNPPEWSRSRMDRCCRGSSWRSSGWLLPLLRMESCTCPAPRSAPSGCSPGAGSRRTGSRRRRRQRQQRSGSRLSRQRPTWKSNRSKSYWGLPTRKTAWREPWIEMVIDCLLFSEVTTLQKDDEVKFFSLVLSPIPNTSEMRVCNECFYLCQHRFTFPLSRVIFHCNLL